VEFAGSELLEEVKAVGGLFLWYEGDVDLVKDLAKNVQNYTQGSVGLLILNPLIIVIDDCEHSGKDMRSGPRTLFPLSYVSGYVLGISGKKDEGEMFLVDTRSCCNKVYGLDVGLIIGGGQADPVEVWRRAVDKIIGLSSGTCGGTLISLTARTEGFIHVDLRYEKYLESEVLEELVSYGKAAGLSRRFKKITKGSSGALTVEGGVGIEYGFTVLRLGCAKLVKCGLSELARSLRRSEHRHEQQNLLKCTGKQVVNRLLKALEKLRGYGGEAYVVVVAEVPEETKSKDRKAKKIRTAAVRLDLSVEELESGIKDVKDEEAKKVLEALSKSSRSLLGGADQKTATLWNVLGEALKKTVELVYGLERGLEVLVELPAEKVERECEAEQPKPGASGGAPS